MELITVPFSLENQLYLSIPTLHSLSWRHAMAKPGGFQLFVKNYLGDRYNEFNSAYGETVSDIFGIPFKILFAPLTLAFDIAGSAPRGFGVPELISKFSAASVFVSSYLTLLHFNLKNHFFLHFPYLGHSRNYLSFSILYRFRKIRMFC